MTARVDKDLKRLNRLEQALHGHDRAMVAFGLSVLFLVLVALLAGLVVGVGGKWLIVVGATVIAGYMALNIGANDVANNMAPAVGSRTMTIGVAVIIAAACEAAGALIAGGDVVNTVASGIIDPGRMASSADFVTAMAAALFAAALWINLATAVGAPVSTTHSVVGGVLGAGVMTAGMAAADWSVMGRIVASWVISPVLGGVIAAAFLYYIKVSVLDAADKLAAARNRVPALVAVMAGSFAAYLMMKAFSRILPVSMTGALAVGIVTGIACFLLVRPIIVRHLDTLPNRKKSIRELFTIPVIGGAALLSFAHGSNDVANAIGPLAAIYSAVALGGTPGATATIPLWIMVVGAVGISIGLLLYGPKLIRTVGSKITKLNRVRAFCVTLAAAITVILASTLGMPVSSTHIAIGALFGVGFLREYVVNRERARQRETPEITLPVRKPQTEQKGVPEKRSSKARKRYLLRRFHLLTIIGAWVITVPASALLAAVLAWGLGATGLVANLLGA
jgi:inorganic phosphate transporter, PiT family